MILVAEEREHIRFLVQQADKPEAEWTELEYKECEEKIGLVDERMSYE